MMFSQACTMQVMKTAADALELHCGQGGHQKALAVPLATAHSVSPGPLSVAVASTTREMIDTA